MRSQIMGHFRLFRGRWNFRQFEFPGPGQSHDAGHAAHESGRPNGIMPASKRFEAAASRHQDQRCRPKNVAKKNPAASQQGQGDPLLPRKPKQFAEDKRHQNARLQGFHSAARLIDTDEAASELNHVADLIGPDTKPAGDLHGDVSHPAHHPLHDQVFGLDRPRDRRQG